MKFFGSRPTHLERAHAQWVRPPGPVAPGLRIGLLGGSFNPAHEGHLHVSEVALKRLGLDYVWWLVTPQNPLKPRAGMASLSERVRSARAVARHPRIIVMDIEHDFRTHYSYDTLVALQKRFPQLKFTWLMGSDNLQIFRRWHRWAELAHRVPIAVIQRPGTVMAMASAKPVKRFGLANIERGICRATPPALTILEGKRNTQSATAIRAAQRYGEAFVGALPT